MSVSVDNISNLLQDQPRRVAGESINLVKHLKEKERKEIQEQVWEEYKEDLQSREDWDRMHADWIKIYYQKDLPKNPPWDGSSEESIPMLVEGCMQFHARAFKAFFSAAKFIVGVPVGKATQDIVDRADRVGKYMSYQLGINNDLSYIRNKDRLLQALPLHGSYFTKTYYDPLKRKNVVENIRPMEMVIPYGVHGIDIEELERKTQIIYQPLRKGKELFKMGWFYKQPEQRQYNEEQKEIQEAIDNATGIRESGILNPNTSKILEQHRYLDLDNDGIEEPYIVWLDESNQELLRISIRYDVDNLGNPISDKDPIEYFTHYVYIENSDGFYGLGLGHLTGKTNTSVNKILRQCIDAGTLQNVGMGIASRTAGLPKGEVELQLGKIITVDGMIEDIRKGVMFRDYPGPSPALIQLMQLLIQRGDRLNMVTDLITGQAQKVYQPTTALAEIEQALETYGAVQTRVYMAFNSELDKLYRLNSLHLNQAQYFSFNDGMGMQDYQVFKDDFKDDLKVVSALDIGSVSSRAKLQKASMTTNFAMQNPLIMTSPEHLREVSRRFFDATGEYDIDRILPPAEMLVQKEQEIKQMQMLQMRAQQEQQAAIIAQKQRTEEIDDQIEFEKLDLKQQEVDIQKMKTQADILSEQVKSNLAADRNKFTKQRTAGELLIKAQDVKNKENQLERSGENKEKLT